VCPGGGGTFLRSIDPEAVLPLSGGNRWMWGIRFVVGRKKRVVVGEKFTH